MAKLKRPRKNLSWLGVIFFALVFSTASVLAHQIDYLGQTSFDSNLQYAKTRVGGISGIAWDASENVLWAVSDDRGKYGSPRVYKISLKVTEGKKMSFDMKIKGVFEIKEKGKVLPVFDFEGVALLPWGNLLLSSEGDDGSRPRRPQRLIDVKIIDASAEESKNTTAVKPFAQLIRDFDIPPWYLSEKSGNPSKGLRTNLGFEGLAASLSGTSIVAAAEAHMTQDPKYKSRILQFDMLSAWTLKATQEWLYPIDPESPGGQWIMRGVSEILPFEGDRWWIMERGVHFAVPLISTQIYEVELIQGFNINPLPEKATTASQLPELKKSLVVDLDKFGPQPVGENFEAMTWGPPLADGRKLLIMANDNNFQNGSPNYFVFAAVTVGTKASTAKPSPQKREAKGH